MIIKLLLFAIALLPTDKDVWPGFLGRGSSDVEPDTIPAKWSPEGVAWQKSISGYGQSSPVIWGDHVFVTSVGGPSKERLVVSAYSLAEGESLWQSTTKSTFLEKNSVYVSRAAPTPVLDKDGIYAYFESGDVVALSFDGKERWKHSLSQKYGEPTNRFGHGASPIQDNESLFVLVDDPEGGYLVCMSKTDGQVRWKTDRTGRQSWSSPAFVVADGEQQIVCSSSGSVDGYELATGNRLWSVDDVGGNTATTPTAMKEGVFLLGASPGRGGENSTLAKRSNGAMAVSRVGDNWKADFVWRCKSATTSFASPMTCGRFAYWINQVGAVYCVDTSTGDVLYTKRVKQSSWATPLAAADRVYFFGKDGLTSVLATGPEFKILHENKLWADDAPPVNNLPTGEEDTEERRQAAGAFAKPTLYGVAAVNGHLVLRTGSQLFCIRK